ncbi:MAG: (4Fe-4S)-binding protein [Boseongicola sp.]|nr:(4Fe-4S)-binding protein [Boseongicola sp.]
MAKKYSGEQIEISFDMKRCIHARNCFLKLPQVFDPSRRPWVDPDAASAEEIAAMVRTCPSGALTFAYTDGHAEEAAPGINRMATLENGPNALHGNLVVDGQAMTRATLCRCGKTKNPPICD